MPKRARIFLISVPTPPVLLISFSVVLLRLFSSRAFVLVANVVLKSFAKMFLSCCLCSIIPARSS